MQTLGGWKVRRVDPKDFGRDGKPFYVIVSPKGVAEDGYATRKGALKAAARAHALDEAQRDAERDREVLAYENDPATELTAAEKAGLVRREG